MDVVLGVGGEATLDTEHPPPDEEALAYHAEVDGDIPDTEAREEGTSEKGWPAGSKRLALLGQVRERRVRPQRAALQPIPGAAFARRDEDHDVVGAVEEDGGPGRLVPAGEGVRVRAGSGLRTGYARHSRAPQSARLSARSAGPGLDATPCRQTFGPAALSLPAGRWRP